MLALPHELVQKILAYLSQQPFREVAPLIGEIHKVASEAAKQE